MLQRRLAQPGSRSRRMPSDHSSSTVSGISPSQAIRRQHPPAMDLRARPQRLHRRRHRGDHHVDRAVRPRIPRPHHRTHRPHHHANGLLQPQLRGRRHHDRLQGHSPTHIRSANHAVALLRWGAGHAQATQQIHIVIRTVWTTLTTGGACPVCGSWAPKSLPYLLT